MDSHQLVFCVCIVLLKTDNLLEHRWCAGVCEWDVRAGFHSSWHGEHVPVHQPSRDGYAGGMPWLSVTFWSQWPKYRGGHNCCCECSRYVSLLKVLLSFALKEWRKLWDSCAVHGTFWLGVKTYFDRENGSLVRICFASGILIISSSNWMF
jgi:hypothetical protein